MKKKISTFIAVLVLAACVVSSVELWIWNITLQKKVTELETNYQNISTILKQQLEPAENSCGVPGIFQAVTVNINGQEYYMNGDFTNKKELAEILVNIDLIEMEESIFDYGYYIGEIEATNQKIVVTPTGW